MLNFGEKIEILAIWNSAKKRRMYIRTNGQERWMDQQMSGFSQQQKS